MNIGAQKTEFQGEFGARHEKIRKNEHQILRKHLYGGEFLMGHRILLNLQALLRVSETLIHQQFFGPLLVPIQVFLVLVFHFLTFVPQLFHLLSFKSLIHQQSFMPLDLVRFVLLTLTHLLIFKPLILQRSFELLPLPTEPIFQPLFDPLLVTKSPSPSQPFFRLSFQVSQHSLQQLHP